MATVEPGGAGVALSEQIDRQQRAALVASARQKLATHQKLSRAEIRALRQFEREQLDAYGPRYLAAMPKGDYARLTGRQPKQLIEAADRYGLPYKPDENTVDIGRMLRWFHEFLANHGAALSVPDGDDAILHMASKGLKDEYVKRRIQEKEIDIERKRIELQTLSESYVPIEPLRQYHNELASLLRRAHMKLSKHFEGTEREVVEQTFEDLITDFERSADSHFNDDPIDTSVVDDQATSTPMEAGSPS